MTQPLPPTTIVTWLDTGRSLQGSGSGTLHGDLGVEGTLYVGNQGARIASSGSGSIIVGSSTQYAMVSGVGASHLAANAYWDGANWQRWNTSGGSTVLATDPNAGVALYTAPAGTGVLPLSGVVVFDHGGNLTLNGELRVNSAVQFGPLGGANDSSVYRESAQTLRVYFHLNVNDNLGVGGGLNVGGQSDLRYVVCEGIDIGSGPLYFAHNGGISLSWDGIQLNSSVQFRTAGILISASRLITNSWDTGVANSLGGPVYTSDFLSVGSGISVYYGYTNLGWGFLAPNNGDPTGRGLANAWVLQSRRALKHNISPLEYDALALVANDALHAVSYDTDIHATQGDLTRVTGSHHDLGFIADDWEPLVPEVCAYDAAGVLAGLDYDRIGAITFEALKQYMARTDARIAVLEAQLARQAYELEVPV